MLQPYIESATALSDFVVCNDADLRQDVPEVTTGSRGSNQAWVKR